MTLSPPSTILSVTLILLLWITQKQVLASLKYVTPDYDVPCPEMNMPCTTLSEYAVSLSLNVSSNALMFILLPGNHSLHRDLDFFKLQNLTFSSTNSSGETMVTCSPEVKFKFELVQYVEISGLNFIGCTNNVISDTDRFILKDTTMDGDSRNGSALQLIHVNSVTISNSEFCFNTGTINANRFEYTIKLSTSKYPSTGGGAVVFSGCTNTFITNSTFQNNFANYGGALYSMKSNLTINNSVFKGNLAVLNSPLTNLIGSGGAIWAQHTNISIFNCMFTNNSAPRDADQARNGNHHGGALGVELSTIKIVNSVFYDNAVDDYGGGIYAYASELLVRACTFINNSATLRSQMYGASAICARKSSKISVNDSVFLENYGSTTVSSISGSVDIRNCVFKHNAMFNYALSGTSGDVIIYDSTFANNTGGAVITNHCTVSINNSTFIGNRVRHGNYGSMYSAYGIMMTLIQCKFIDNSGTANGGAASFTRSSTVLMIDTILFNNTATSGGAIYVSRDSNFTVRNSMLIGNRAKLGGGILSVESELTIENSTFFKNTANIGGAIHTNKISESLNSTINIQFGNVTFVQNKATQHGAAIYIKSCVLVSEGSLVIRDNSANTSVFYAVQSTAFLLGNTSVVYNNGSIVAFLSNLTLSGNSSFSYNTAKQPTGEGGAVTCVQSKFTITGNAVFDSNQAISGGAIMATECTLHNYGIITLSQNRATFGGAIHAYQSELNFEGSGYLLNNVAQLNGGGVYALGTSIRLLSGTLQLEGNTAQLGGGMYLEVNSKVSILKKSSEEGCHPHCRIKFLLLQFINNSADKGGAMYIADHTYSSICGSNMQLTARECFYQSLALYDSVNADKHYHYNIINTYFTNNTAKIAGGTLFGGLFDRCLLSPMSEIFKFAETFVEYEPFVQGSLDALSFMMIATNLEEENVNYATVSSYPSRLCFCRDSVPQCSYQPPKQFTLKGEVVMVTLVAVDHVGNVIPGSIIHSSLSSGDGRFNDGQSTLVTNGSCTDLKYNIFSPHESETLYLYAEGPCNNTGKSLRHIDIEFLPCICPTGLQPSTSKDSCECECDTRIRDYIANCTNESLIRNGEYWITYVNSSDGFLVYPHCPFDYCQSPNTPVEIDLTIEDGEDMQCAFNRSGMLCGACKDDLSLTLGSSHCESCSNVWLLMLLPFFIAGILFVALLLVCNLGVSIGTINGLIFYANIIAANRTVFLPFTSSNFPTVFIAWLNLDVGIESCFFNGLDSYIKTWLQLVFPLYMLSLIGVIIFISKYNRKFNSMILRMKPIVTFSTLILLSYTKLLRIIITSFSFATLKYPDGSEKTVWLFDAEIDYVHGKHMVLFIVALVVLLIGIAYTLLLLSWQWILKCPDKVLKHWYLRWIKNDKLYSLMDAYNAPYVEKHRYWTGLLLLTRVVLYLISSVNVHHDPSVNLFSTICVIGSVLMLSKLNGRIYKNGFVETLESSFLFNIIIFSAATFYIRDSAKHSQTALAYTSTSIAFITFLIIVLYHMKYESIINKSLRIGSSSRGIISDTFTTHSVTLAESTEPCSYSEMDGVPQLKSKELQSDNSSVEMDDSDDETESACDSDGATRQTSSSYFLSHVTECAVSDHREYTEMQLLSNVKIANDQLGKHFRSSITSMADESDSSGGEDESTPLLHVS